MNRAVAVGVLGLASCLLLEADKGGKHHEKHHGRGHDTVNVNVTFAVVDVDAIRGYYRGRSLPPGMERHLLRKGTLPPGIAKKVMPFPPELERRLPPLPHGMCRGYVGDRAILYDPVDRIIYDVADIVVSARRI
jgi:hypothetical protein